VRIALSGRNPLLCLAILGLIGHQVAEALVPVIVGLVIDHAIAPGDGPALIGWLAVLAAVFTGLLLSWRTGELLSVRLSEEGARAVRRALISRSLAPAGFARRRSPGELLSVAESDAARTSGIVWVIGPAAANLAAVLTAASTLLTISVPLSLLVLIATPVLVVLLHILTTPLERRADAEQAAVAAASATAADLLSGLRALSGIRAEDAADARFAAVNSRSLQASRRAVTAKASYTAASMAGSAVLLAVVAAVAGAEALAGGISIGELVTVLGLAQFLHWPVSGLAFAGAELATVRASSKRVGAVLSAETALADPDGADPDGADPDGADPDLADPDGAGAVGSGRSPQHIVFDALVTAHAGPLSLHVTAGEAVALQCADPRAAGELQEVLSGLRPPVSGGVLVDGRRLEPGDVLAPPRNPAIFAGTLRENIELHHPLPDDRLAEAASVTALADVTSASEHGWSLVVGERGLTLSGGQRQRVALARAIARRAPVLALHDPLSAVDSVTEETICSRLPSARAGMITIFIDASPALLRACDGIVDVPATRAPVEVSA